MTGTRLAAEIANGNPAERILVIAPNHEEFVYWCRQNDINPHAANVRPVLREEHLRGYSGAWYVFLGVPDGIKGLCLLRMFDHMKATRGFKSVEAIPGSSDDPHA